MKKPLVVLGLALVGLVLVSCGKGVENPVSPAGGPCGNLVINGANINVACGGNVNQVQVQASPTPVPATSDCRVDWIRKSGPDYIPVGGEATYSITPMQTFKDQTGATQEVEVSAPCNNARPAPVWSVGDARILSVSPYGTGFEAKVKRLATGAGSLQVIFEGRTIPWSIQGGTVPLFPTPCTAFACGGDPTPTPTVPPTPTPTPTVPLFPTPCKAFACGGDTTPTPTPRPRG